jgi:hypothetical protein
VIDCEQRRAPPGLGVLFFRRHASPCLGRIMARRYRRA